MLADRGRELLDTHPQHPDLAYNVACCESLAGRSADAIEHLRLAIDGAEHFRAMAADDSDFDPVRDEPAFKELVALALALFNPESHEPLLDEPWDAAAIEAAIREIVAETEGAFDDGWPAASRRRGRAATSAPCTLGGSGVICAIDDLQRRGLVELERDYVPYLEREYVPDYPEDEHQRGLHFGEAGIRLVRQRLAPSSANADRLAELIADNAHDEHRELMWGSAGTMLVAAEYCIARPARLAGQSSGERALRGSRTNAIRSQASGHRSSSASRRSTSALRTDSRGACSARGVHGSAGPP